jgi:hypothetical protein
MERRVLTIDQYVKEDARIETELDNLVELAILESEKTEEYRNIYKTVLFEKFELSRTEDLTFDQKRMYLDYVKEALELSGEELNESVLEANSSLKEEYAKHFRETLKGMNVSSLKELDKTGKSEFFKKIKEGWVRGTGKKSAEVSEAVINEADIKDAEAFKKWAEAKLKKQHGDKFDQKKADEVIDGLIKDCDGNWGEAVCKLNKA